eukprot:RCo041001
MNRVQRRSGMRADLLKNQRTRMSRATKKLPSRTNQRLLAQKSNRGLPKNESPKRKEINKRVPRSTHWVRSKSRSNLFETEMTKKRTNRILTMKKTLQRKSRGIFGECCLPYLPLAYFTSTSGRRMFVRRKCRDLRWTGMPCVRCSPTQRLPASEYTTTPSPWWNPQDSRCPAGSVSRFHQVLCLRGSWSSSNWSSVFPRTTSFRSPMLTTGVWGWGTSSFPACRRCSSFGCSATRPRGCQAEETPSTTKRNSHLLLLRRLRQRSRMWLVWLRPRKKSRSWSTFSKTPRSMRFSAQRFPKGASWLARQVSGKRCWPGRLLARPRCPF